MGQEWVLCKGLHHSVISWQKTLAKGAFATAEERPGRMLPIAMLSAGFLLQTLKEFGYAREEVSDLPKLEFGLHGYI